MLRATPAYLKSLSPQLLKGERNRELLASGWACMSCYRALQKVVFCYFGLKMIPSSGSEAWLYWNNGAPCAPGCVTSGYSLLTDFIILLPTLWKNPPSCHHGAECQLQIHEGWGKYRKCAGVVWKLCVSVPCLEAWGFWDQTSWQCWYWVCWEQRCAVTWRFWVVLERHIVYNDLCGLQPWIYNNLEFGIDLDTRVALVGPNGAGKSTLLKLLTGEVCLQHRLPCSGPLFFG